ncbi:guanylate kinase [Entomoplasma ellychniae]|uniref:Guanylate kinase n=2 Tax=Entomoplasmataceae TaxID=33925 RepID=A0A2S5RGL5_9MOLU|nr:MULTISPECIES: guanylate kinase [Entomoplasmataceae]PPE04989.1 guanylate kinase [Entomoplasma ellychniae]PPE06479.1 guanylate kinase [Mesoplasma corruscae]
MSNKKGRIVIISGPSGVGKGSVNEKLLQDKKLNLEYSISMTTRKPRNGEVDGVNYYFVSKEEFASAIVNNELIEHASFVGNSYGTPRKYVEEKLKNSKNVILEIEVDGATQVLRNEANVLSIFLMPPNITELATRIKGRNSETDEVIKQRLDKALLEIPLKHSYDYVVENDSVENAVAKITDILIREQCIVSGEASKYEKLVEIVNEIVEEKYLFFVDHWKENVQTAANKKEDIKQADSFDAKSKLVEILSNKVYKKVLAHGDFNKINSKEFIDFKIQKLMFKVNFFSINQRNDANDED